LESYKKPSLTERSPAVSKRRKGKGSIKGKRKTKRSSSVVSKAKKLVPLAKNIY